MWSMEWYKNSSAHTHTHNRERGREARAMRKSFFAAFSCCILAVSRRVLRVGLTDPRLVDSSLLDSIEFSVVNEAMQSAPLCKIIISPCAVCMVH